MINGCYLLSGAEYYVAVDNKGLWPNLTLLPNGEIVAAVYNQPSHGYGNGEVELWVSGDGGKLWTLRSTISDHSDHPEIVRMNHAVGLNAKGELIALVSGWSEGREAPTLPIQICISQDNGQSWQRRGFDVASFPFGDIVLSPDGTLTCAIHDDFEFTSHFFVSKDDGQTWGNRRLLAKPGDETALLRCSNGKWLAAMRTWPTEEERQFVPGGGTGKILLFTSTDDGMTWGHEKQISLQGQAPAHLLQLNDGSILLTYGSRTEGLYGVIIRLSEDDGESWSKPYTLISVPSKTDCGYPASVELEDGTIVTAYYFGAVPWHARYHMGIARWRLEYLSQSAE